MISETSFARGFSSFWVEYFPWLNSYCQSINKFRLKQIVPRLQESESPEHRAINNTIAFIHFQEQYRGSGAELQSSKDQAIEYISRFPRSGVSTYKFNDIDKKIIEHQVNNLAKRYRDNIILSPFFPGCGILANCRGDLIHNNRLVEIKAGERLIIPSDIKQLIIYITLNWISTSQKHDIEEIEVYNPRLGYSWIDTVNNLFVSITDLPKEEIFDQLAKYLVVQSEDIEI